MFCSGSPKRLAMVAPKPESMSCPRPSISDADIVQNPRRQESTCAQPSTFAKQGRARRGTGALRHFKCGGVRSGALLLTSQFRDATVHTVRQLIVCELIVVMHFALEA